MSDREAISHAWQAHRIACVELAIKAGAPVAELIDVAETISLYILTKSGFERAAGGSHKSEAGKAGGNARAATLTSERRSEIARTAAEARWNNLELDRPEQDK